MRRNWGDATASDVARERRRRVARRDRRLRAIRLLYLAVCLISLAALVVRSTGCVTGPDGGTDGAGTRPLYDHDGRLLRPLRVSELLLHPDEDTITWIDLGSAIVVWLPEEECPICAGHWEDR